jgi:hypothetical protein
MPRRQQPETAVQRAIVQHLKMRAAKGCFWYAIPFGGARSKIEAAIMQATGTRRGTPDLGFVYQGRAYFLEVKAEEESKPTEHQLQAIADIKEAGGFACIGHGLDRCLKILEDWGLLKGRVA